MIDDTKIDGRDRFTPTLVVKQPEKIYQRSAVETADPGRLVVMFYDRLLRELRSGLSALAEAGEPGQDSPEARDHFQTARNILNALTQSIDHSIEGDIGDNLTSLYLAFYRQILEAELDNDASKIENIIPSLEQLRGAWEVVATQSDEG